MANGESRASSRVIRVFPVVREYIRSTNWASPFRVDAAVLAESSRFAKSVSAVATSALVKTGLWKWLKNQ